MDNTKPRIFYFDVMKGVAIFLMVIGHVMLFSFNINPSEPSKFAYFNMPLFFYISGYFAYKSFDSWKDVLKRFVTRGASLLVPYVAFLLLFFYFQHGELPSVFSFIGGGKYWFLHDLFIISSFFLLYEYVVKRISSAWLYVAIWILPLLFLISIKLMLNHISIGETDLQAIITRLTNYYRYYLIGYLCHKYTAFNHILFENSVVCALGFVAYILNWYYFNYHNIALIFLGTLGAIIVLQNFIRNTVNVENWIGKLFIILGKCSLGIYVIHYFFIPDISGITSSFLNVLNPFIWQLTFAVTMAIPIIMASVFVYRLISQNQWLFLIFFGKKTNK